MFQLTRNLIAIPLISHIAIMGELKYTTDRPGKGCPLNEGVLFVSLFPLSNQNLKFSLPYS